MSGSTSAWKVLQAIPCAGTLEAAATGVEARVLFLEFQGDVQQGILPPAVRAASSGLESSCLCRGVGHQLTLGAIARSVRLDQGLLEVKSQ
jgi:hypothetical protein